MTTWRTDVKTGDAWHYDEQNFTYDNTTDPNNGRTVYYDYESAAPAWTNQDKS